MTAAHFVCIKGIVTDLRKWEIGSHTSEALKQLRKEPKVVLHKSWDQCEPDITNVANFVECRTTKIMSTKRSHESRRQSVNLPLNSNNKKVKKVTARRQTVNALPLHSTKTTDVEKELKKIFRLTQKKDTLQPKVKRPRGRPRKIAKSPEEIRNHLIKLFEDPLDDIEINRSEKTNSLPVSINISSTNWPGKRKSDSCEVGCKEKVQRNSHEVHSPVASEFAEFVPLFDCFPLIAATPIIETIGSEETVGPVETALVIERPILRNDIELRTNTTLNKKIKNELIDLTNIEDTEGTESEGTVVKLEDLKFKRELIETSEEAKVPEPVRVVKDMPLLSPDSPMQPTQTEATLPTERPAGEKTLPEPVQTKTSTLTRLLATAPRPSMQKQMEEATKKVLMQYPNLVITPIETEPQPSQRINIQSEHRFVPILPASNLRQVSTCVNTVQTRQPGLQGHIQPTTAIVTNNSSVQTRQPGLQGHTQPTTTTATNNSLVQTRQPGLQGHAQPTTTTATNNSLVQTRQPGLQGHAQPTTTTVTNNSLVQTRQPALQGHAQPTATTFSQSHQQIQNHLQSLENRFGSIPPQMIPVQQQIKAYPTIAPRPSQPPCTILSNQAFVDLVLKDLILYDSWCSSCEEFQNKVGKILPVPDLESDTNTFRTYINSRNNYFREKLLRSIANVHVDNFSPQFFFNKVCVKFKEIYPALRENYIVFKQLTNMNTLLQRYDGWSFGNEWMNLFITCVVRNYREMNVRLQKHRAQQLQQTIPQQKDQEMQQQFYLQQQKILQQQQQQKLLQQREQELKNQLLQQQELQRQKLLQQQRDQELQRQKFLQQQREQQLQKEKELQQQQQQQQKEKELQQQKLLQLQQQKEKELQQQILQQQKEKELHQQKLLQQQKEKELQQQNQKSTGVFMTMEQQKLFEEQLDFCIKVKKWLQRHHTDKEKSVSSEKNVDNGVSSESADTQNPNQDDTAKIDVPPIEAKKGKLEEPVTTTMMGGQCSDQPEPSDEDNSDVQIIDEKVEVIDLTWIEDNDNDDIYEMIEKKNFVIKNEDVEVTATREAVSPADSGLGSPRQNNDTYKCFCSKEAMYICQCKTHMYCSRECQMQDWIYHQPMCEKMSS